MTDQPWQSIASIPIGRPVEIKSVTGIVCKAQVGSKLVGSIRRGRKIRSRRGNLPVRINCRRLDQEKCQSGDIVAIHWRELTK